MISNQQTNVKIIDFSAWVKIQKKKKKASDFLHKNKIKETKKTFKYNLKFIYGFLKNI